MSKHSKGEKTAMERFNVIMSGEETDENCEVKQKSFYVTFKDGFINQVSEIKVDNLALCIDNWDDNDDVFLAKILSENEFIVLSCDEFTRIVRTESIDSVSIV